MLCIRIYAHMQCNEHMHNVYVCTVCVQIFTALYFREFCEWRGGHENINAKMWKHTVQDCCCRPPFAKLKSWKLLGAGHLQNIRPAKICTHTVCTMHCTYSTVHVHTVCIYNVLYYINISIQCTVCVHTLHLMTNVVLCLCWLTDNIWSRLETR